MILEIRNEFEPPRKVRCTRLIVRDEYDNPVAAVFEPGENIVMMVKCDEPDFPELLRILGVEQAPNIRILE